MTDWLSRMFVRDYGRVNDPGVRVSYGIMAGVVGIVLNVALCAAKAAVGVAAGSVSIVADAVNNLSDASSNIVKQTRGLRSSVRTRALRVPRWVGCGRSCDRGWL